MPFFVGLAFGKAAGLAALWIDCIVKGIRII
jgi:hypothetical protein